METSENFRLISYLIQALSAFICLLLSLSYYFIEKKQQTPDKLIHILITYYTINIFRWLVVSSSPVFTYAYPLFYIGLMFTRVTGFHLMFTLTGTGMKERFPVIHYILPVAVLLITVIVLLFVNYKQQYPGHFQCLYYSRIILIILSAGFTFFYVSLGLRRLKRYLREIEKYSADCERSSMKWVYLIIRMFHVMLSLVPLFLVVQFFGEYILATYIIPLLWAFLSIALYSILCYNLLIGNYIMISPYPEDSNKKADSKLNRHVFESYISINKLYLDPKLKITDLLLPFCTNRHYMSEFINKEYKMNFSRYINSLRMQELEKMRCTAEYSRLSEIELILKAGFSSYRSYLYFLKKQKEEISNK